MVDNFLSSRDSRRWRSERTGAECLFFIGEGNSALEVVVTQQDESPTKNWLQELYTDRRGGRVNPILVIVLYHEGSVADICGPVGEDPPVKRELDPGQVARVSDSALEKPNRNAAQRFLREILDQIDDDLVGVRNQGLLTTHELKVGVPDRDDWSQATDSARSLLDEEARDLIGNLGYAVDRLSDQSYVLKDVSEDRERAVAVFLQDNESFDHAQDRFTGQSPISYALTEAEKERLDYVIASSENTLRLYTTDPDAGFGSRGRTDTFVEINTDLLREDDAGYLWLLFSAEALRPEGSLHGIMENSKDYAASLGKRLRERIYDDVVPDLAEAIADARNLTEPSKDQLDETYRMALVLLYRLLFVAYAEDERFLPWYNPQYRKHSLKQKAHDLQESIEEGLPFDEQATGHWDDVMELSRAIHNGHAEWSLPEYDGTLLSEDTGAGAALADIELTDDQFGPVLASLLIDETEDGFEGPVDFRDIGVRDFGVIYEGLLESELSVADQPLKVDAEGHYVPIEAGGQQTLVETDEEVVVEEGQVYLHGQSGDRKATGSYYTKTRFVEHLLNYSLDPALDDHIDRLEELRETEGDYAAAEAFFDIRVADIAMGSGHFLVGAVDRVESRLMSYLSRDDVTLPHVEEELDRLRDAAEDAFETTEEMPAVERSQLLRRQVARRCIFGADLNPLATELARLSIWVHTFVPGLPLTFLDYNLVTGDSLAGIGTLDEVSDILDLDEQTSLSVFMPGGSDVLDDLRDDIDSLGRLADADAEQVQEARETRAKIDEQLEQTQAAFDILAGSRIDDNIDPNVVNKEDIDLTSEGHYKLARKALESTNPLHFPAAFPEVFMGEQPGFNVVVGNPPWEEATLEEDEFWLRYKPGLMGQSSADQEQTKKELRDERPDLVKQYQEELQAQEKLREILKNGPYPGMGTGDPDLYKAFCWRFWNLVGSGGNVGVVLPRSVFSGAGSEDFRRTLLNKALVRDLTFLKNKDGWVFDNMEPRYTIGLIGFEENDPSPEDTLPLRGPYPDLESYKQGLEQGPFRFPMEEAKNWTGKASFPLLPSAPESVEVFGQLSSSPRLEKENPKDWHATPYRELDATMDKTKDDGTRLMHFTEDPPDDFWPVFKGASFAPPDKEQWISDTGVRYAWADPDVMVEFLDDQRNSKAQHWASAFYEMPEEWLQDKDTLPCLNPRIAFRDIARSTDQRTVRAALVPPEVFLTNKAPYFLWPKGDSVDEAYLLGILASIPLDWYARRFVELGVNFHIIRAFPVPRPGRNSELRQRVVELAGRLSAKDQRFADWADKVGVECGPLEEKDELNKIYELDAVVAHCYGLTRENLEIIFETFHDNWDHEPRMNAVLEYYDEWAERLDDEEEERAEAMDD